MERAKCTAKNLKRTDKCWVLGYVPKRRRSKKQNRRTAIGYNITEPKSESEQYYLGDIWLGTTNNVIPTTWEKCKAHFVTRGDVDNLIMDFSNVTVVVSITTELQFLKDLLSTKIFKIRFHLREGNVIASLYVSSLPLPKFNNKIGNVLKTVFSLVLNICSEYNEINTIESSASIESFSDLYRCTMISQDKISALPAINTQHPQLKPTLRPYQMNAIRWMVSREQELSQTEVLHPLYEEVVLSSGIKIYFDKHTGYIDLDKPMVKGMGTGGILADEMGLGKTVEVLACILLHPKLICSTLDPNQISTDDLHDNIISPIVDRQSKKRKLPSTLTKPDTKLVDKAKKIKVPDNWVKARSKKSALRVALEIWYENMLSGKKEEPSYEEPAVHCICGNDMENDDCFECVDCSKIQHGTCVGYKTSYGAYRCPQCWNNQPLIESRATLIVAPSSLRRQWCEEICKHVRGNLKVLEYGGAGTNLATIYPTELKDYDLVITTYNVLQSELRLTENGQVITLRRQPKYSIPGSPITRIKWWRLCLDEAQTVETPGHMVSVMSQKLCAHHRWAVTGTPISKDISDLFGLVGYLQFAPYSEPETWNNLLYKPYINGRKQKMHEFLAQILWRSAKDDVIEQIKIPKQTVVEHWIEFTAVEKFFYEREHELSCQEFLRKLTNMDLGVSLKTLNKSVLKRLMAPLLALRQACAHHQAVRGRYLATRKQVNSMEDLLNALIAKNINESEEHLRIIISSLNGLAGIYLLLQNSLQAVEEYRKVLQVSARFSKERNDLGLPVDKLQLIHTMHNLASVLEVYPSIPRTLRDHRLTNDCQQIEKEYMERFAKQSSVALKECIKFQVSVKQLQEKFVLSPGQWFSDLLDWVSTNNLFNDYVTRLTTLLDNASVVFKYPNERTILYMLADWDENIGKLRDETMDAVNNLFEYGDDNGKILIQPALVEMATDCHLRPQNKTSKKKGGCLACRANVSLKQYECKLFGMTKKDEDMSNTGSWKPTVEEFALKALHSLGKARNANKDVLSDGEIHISILDVLKKEFKEIRKFWTYLNQQISAKDELDMCKIRLSLKDKTKQDKDCKQSKTDKIMKSLTNDIINKLDTIHMLGEHELDYHKAVLHTEERTNSAALEKTLGTHKYLETLRKQQSSGQSPDPCPICKNVLEKHWNILPCGHCYCLDCIRVLLGQTLGHHICCCICREKQLIADISYIHTDGKPEEADEIKGNFSSKVGAIVKLVIKLKSEDADVKVLVFSNWIVLLKLLHSVFAINDIVTETLMPENFEKSLQTFKDPSKNVTALLLPVQLGSKGLNLIEATHVIFVEPLLNPADELQAIGRVHRIGQTKPTIVHKFLIRDTIEENIYQATATNADEWDKNKVTLAHIKRLFEDAATNSLPVEVDQPVDEQNSADNQSPRTTTQTADV